MLSVWERINSSRRRIALAIETKDTRLIQNETRSQAEAGAEHLEVNAGTFQVSEGDTVAWLVATVQAVVDVHLCLGR